jgi:hypothetical protein
MLGGTGVMAVDIAPLIQAGAHWAAVIVLTIVAAWARSHLQDQAARDMVLKAVANGINYAENHFGATSGKPYTIPMATGIGAMALRYTTELVPDAVKRMGLDDKSLAKIVVAKMPGIDRTPLDPSTVDQITAATAPGVVTAAPSVTELLKVLVPALLPQLEDVVNKAVAQYGKPNPQPDPKVPTAVG